MRRGLRTIVVVVIVISIAMAIAIQTSFSNKLDNLHDAALSSLTKRRSIQCHQNHYCQFKYHPSPVHGDQRM